MKSILIHQIKHFHLLHYIFFNKLLGGGMGITNLLTQKIL